ncbi:hypothetical protein H6F86_08170 [Phormidium sp. FACHB-592]|uniref:Peptide ABC transporter substrate-binding protein n=1 Tax=Stenomitos frigidus AS-A4 TaxID=2933935 RepID=A0ABV0KJK7_9CYAN|nr:MULTISPECIES: hypothetical protein [Cyanophyceae]MBD2037297.1 hypothetical protein [Leptolyngbya sp. FACHB-321]MBD2073863.1 hypothetical protein [Phormidium sp. FACHB-592]
MPESFLVSASNASTSKVPTSKASESPVNTTSTEATPERTSDRESLRILVIGSRQGVLGTIQTLHRLRFAEVHEWSPLLPSANPGEVMSILTRYSIMT